MRQLRTLVLAAVFFALGPALAAPVMDMGILAGFRINDADSGVAGISIDGKSTFQVGGLAFLPMNEQFTFRSGFIYTQRHYEAKDGVDSIDVEFAHFDIPLTFMYRLGDLGGIFAGPGVALKISDDCGGSDCRDAKSMIVPITFGGHFKVAPQFAAEIFYEMTGGEISNAIENTRAFGVNAVITFE